MRFFILLIASSWMLQAAENYAADGDRWWAHIRFLADDKLEGRNTGSPGHRKAAEYVAAKFQEAGLKPGLPSGYLQSVPFRSSQIDEAGSSIEIFQNGKWEPVKLGEEMILSPRTNMSKPEEFDAVFVGYGLVIPDAGHDDLAGIDLRGKLAVYLSGGPARIPGNLKSHYSSSSERWKALKRAGAVGVIRVDNPKSMDVPWTRQAANRFLASMSLIGPGMDDSAGQRISVAVNPDKMQRILEGTGQDFRKILDQANSDQTLPKFPLKAKFRIQSAVRTEPVESQNVIGVIMGSDPVRRSEYVVLSAHIDHLGKAKSVEGDSVFNGAMDNASGIAWLLETAYKLKVSGLRPKRSLIFVAVTGEEKGLQGSRYFAAKPGVPGARIVANINMDMVLPLFPLKYLEVQGLGESTLGDDIRAVCAPLAIEPQFDKEPDRNRFIRSDQYSFIKRGIPALAFKFGWTPGSPEEKIFRDWYRDRYHGVRDDLDQPVDREGAGKFTRVLQDLLLRVANAPSRPEWKSDSFFRRFATTPSD